MSKSITLAEYEFLQCRKKEDAHYLPPDTFNQVELFILENQDVSPFLKITTKGGYGKVLQAQNFVGLIQTTDGTTIEILPKIHRQAKDLDKKKQIQKSQNIVIKMLKTLRTAPFKTMNFAHLQYTHMHLLEIFIAMFLEELGVLIRKGMQANYQLVENTHSPFLKGKLKIREQIAHNSVNASRFAVEYDEFTHDILPNQLIKTTLQFLYKRSKWAKNQQEIRKYMFMFEEISPCHDYKQAFRSLALNRNYAHYEKSIAWCKIFLLGNSFSPYKGGSIAWALLFDMNLLFESYVAHLMRKTYPKLNIRTQDKTHYLARTQDGEKKFWLKPDIVIDDDKIIIIIDTKWKLLDEHYHNNNISQSDIYQMYAYATKYQGQDKDKKIHVHLVYPKTNIDFIEGYFFDKTENLTLDIRFFNLQEDTISLRKELLPQLQ